MALRAGQAYAGVRSHTAPASFAVVDAGTPALMTLQSSVAYSEAVDVRAEPGLAYLLQRSGLHIYDTVDPLNVIALGVWEPLDAGFASLDVADGIAAVATSWPVLPTESSGIMTANLPSSATWQGQPSEARIV